METPLSLWTSLPGFIPLSLFMTEYRCCINCLFLSGFIVFGLNFLDCGNRNAQAPRSIPPLEWHSGFLQSSWIPASRESICIDISSPSPWLRGHTLWEKMRRRCQELTQMSLRWNRLMSQPVLCMLGLRGQTSYARDSNRLNKINEMVIKISF